MVKFSTGLRSNGNNYFIFCIRPENVLYFNSAVPTNLGLRELDELDNSLPTPVAGLSTSSSESSNGNENTDEKNHNEVAGARNQSVIADHGEILLTIN